MKPSFQQRALRLIADNRRMVGKLLFITLAMFCFGFALVPIYRTVCTALGINVLSVAELQTGAGAAASNGQVDMSRVVTVEFDANVRGQWDFKPERASIDVHPGQLTTVLYDFRNRQSRAVTVQAIPSYAPAAAMSHFNKVECFCFSEHVVQAGESVRWPVVFVVDGRLPKDIRTITLSYTFFEAGGKVPPRAGGGRSHGRAGASVVSDADGVEAVRRRGSFGRTMLAVGWSFFGVRKGKDLERDMNELNPLHLVVAGVVAAALFVVAVVALVNWVVSSGVAA